MTEPTSSPEESKQIPAATSYDPVTLELIKSVREAIMQDFPECLTWTDDSIREGLQKALERISGFNEKNPLTLRLNAVPERYKSCVWTGGAVECLKAAESRLEPTHERIAIYRSMARFWENQFEELAKLATRGTEAVSLGSRGRRGRR